MLPTDRAMHIGMHWRVDGLKEAAEKSRRHKYGSSSLLAMPVRDWPDDRPLPVLTAVPEKGVRVAHDIEPGLREFVRVAASKAWERWQGRPESEQVRPRPLLGVPLFDTRGSGGQRLRGQVLETMLHVLRQEGLRADVDVALVLRDEKAFALAQVRRKHDVNESWPQLAGTGLLEQARRVAEYARDGRLVPFMGAGVSISAGAPNWSSLIGLLADKAGLDAIDKASLMDSGRDVLDQAAYLRTAFVETKPGGSSQPDGGFAAAIVDAVSLPHYGLAPALLASLKTEQAITLNYDQLFEFAAADAGDPRTVIPDDEVGSSSKWLLKLHGSVASPESIVLTRHDYRGYNSSHDALSAIVKATLITHHLLFVGFGLSDDHFHQIIHDVRRSLPKGSTGTSEMATALTMSSDPLDHKLWQGKLGLIPMSGTHSSRSESARTLEIILDALLAFATDSHSYLLSSGYEDVLDPADSALRKSLLKFVDDTNEDQRGTAAWTVLKKSLGDLGFES